MIQLSDEGFLCWAWEFKDDEKMLENIKNIRAAENIILRHNISMMEITKGEIDTNLANVDYYATLLGTKIKVYLHEFEMLHERERLDELTDTFFDKRDNGELFINTLQQEFYNDDEKSDIQESDSHDDIDELEDPQEEDEIADDAMEI